MSWKQNYASLLVTQLLKWKFNVAVRQQWCMETEGPVCRNALFDNNQTNSTACLLIRVKQYLQIVFCLSMRAMGSEVIVSRSAVGERVLCT